VVCYGQRIQTYNLILGFGIEEPVSTQPTYRNVGPYLNLATICEKYILEANGALTLFRIVDRFNVQGTTPEMPQTTISVNLIVNFRAGHVLGPSEVGVRIVDETESSVQPEMKIPILFEAPEEKAAQIIGQINLAVSRAGLYWIVIKLAEEEYTRIPIRVVYQRLPTVQPGT
jgi:hypothetical protein